MIEKWVIVRMLSWCFWSILFVGYVTCRLVEGSLIVKQVSLGLFDGKTAVAVGRGEVEEEVEDESKIWKKKETNCGLGNKHGVTNQYTP